jgi:hypothetical protein
MGRAGIVIFIPATASQGMRASIIQSPPDDQGALSSIWVLVTKDMDILAQSQIAEAARPIVRRWPLTSWTGRLGLWTDDYSSLLPILRWSR